MICWVINKFPAFRGSRCLLLCSQQSANSPYPPTFHFLISILILSFHLHLDFPSDFFLTGFSLRCSLLCSQQCANSPYPPPIPFPYTHFNIIFSSTPRFSQWFFSYRISPAAYYCVHNSAPTVLTLLPFYFLIAILILFFINTYIFPVLSFSQDIPHHTQAVISVLFHPRSAHTIHLSLLTALTKCTNHGDPHYGSSLIRLSLSPSFIQLSSSEIRSRKSTVYILPLTWKTQYDNHTKESSFGFGVI